MYSSLILLQLFQPKLLHLNQQLSKWLLKPVIMNTPPIHGLWMNLPMTLVQHIGKRTRLHFPRPLIISYMSDAEFDLPKVSTIKTTIYKADARSFAISFPYCIPHTLGFKQDKNT